MDEISRIDFTDGDTGGDGFAGVRVCGKTIGLTLSLRADGDMEVFLEPEVALEVARALERAAIGATRRRT